MRHAAPKVTDIVVIESQPMRCDAQTLEAVGSRKGGECADHRCSEQDRQTDAQPDRVKQQLAIADWYLRHGRQHGLRRCLGEEEAEPRPVLEMICLAPIWAT